MSLLPAGYTRLEYIESSSESSYINTGITTSSNDLKIISDAQPTVASSANNVLWQINTTYQDAGRTIQFGLFSSNWQLHMPGIFATGTTSATTARRKITMTAIGTAWALSGVTGSGTHNYIKTGSWRNVAITAARGNHKHYSYEIYLAGKLVRMMIPCKNVSGTIGMYDVVGGAFYGNVGTGSYTAGGVVADDDNAFNPVEYIESSGTQYVDTGFKPNQNTRVITDILPLTTSTAFYFGSRNSTTVSSMAAFGLVQLSSTEWRSDYGSDQLEIEASTVLKRIAVDKNKNTITIDGTTHANTANTFQGSYPLWLFAMNSIGTAANIAPMRMYSAEIHDNGTPVRNYIPHVTALGTPGLLDTVNDVFYASVSTTDFTAGPEVVSEWTLLEYVESDGSQYVDTKYKPSNLTEFEIKISHEGTNVNYFFGGGTTWQTNAVLVGVGAFSFGSYGAAQAIFATGTPYVMSFKDNTLKYDDTDIVTVSVSAFQSAVSAYLFGINITASADEFFTGKIYYAKIHDNGIQVYDLRSCRLTDGRVGLVDESSGAFFESASTTALIAGPDLITIPEAPTNLAQAVMNGVLTLTWTASEDAEGYNIYRNGEYVATTFETSFTEAIIPAIGYEYGVTAYNSFGEGEMASISVPATEAPAKVTGLRITETGFSYASIAWDKIVGAESYRIYRDGELIAELAETAFSDRGLTKETTYTYGVSAVNGVGENAPAEITVTTTEFKLVTDRTAADVVKASEYPTADNIEEWLAGLKGAYNYTDFNRVETAVLYVIDRLHIAGWYVTVDSKLDWKYSDFPTATEMKRYLDNIRLLRSTLPKGLPAVPADMNGFTYTEANNIELLLEMLDAAVTNIMANVYYSNELHSGEVM